MDDLLLNIEEEFSVPEIRDEYNFAVTRPSKSGHPLFFLCDTFNTHVSGGNRFIDVKIINGPPYLQSIAGDEGKLPDLFIADGNCIMFSLSQEIADRMSGQEGEPEA